MKRLTTEDSLKPLVAQFVPIKIDVKSDEYRDWSREHKPSRNAIPQMFIVQADGEELFNQVGGLPAETLEKVLTGALSKSGVTLSDVESEQVQKAVAVATKQIENEDLFAAMKTVMSVPGSTDDSIRCFAEPVIQLRELVAQLTESSNARISAVMEKAKSRWPDKPSEQVAVAEEFVQLVDGIKKFKPTEAARKKLESVVRKNLELKRMVRDLRSVKSLIKSKASSRELRLQELAARYPDTPIDKQVAEVLESEGIKTNWRRLSVSEFRKWQSKNGNYSIDAMALIVSDDEVRLENKNGQMVTVEVTNLSDSDQAWLKSNIKQ